MKKPPNINIIIILILAIILLDIYYQLVKTSGSLFETGWVINRILILSAFVLVVIMYFAVKRLLGSKQKQEQFSRRLIFSQEQNRKLIASELHDSLGQNLVLVNNMILQIISSNGSGPHSKNLKEISTLVTDTIEEVRRISYNLYPHQIEKLGLTAALKTMINRVASSAKIKFEWSVENIDNTFSKGNEINFFRIIQEAVNNITKHSEAQEAEVKILKSPGFVTAHISDNGKGFEAEKIFEGIGLSNIYERAKIMKGTLKIDSSANRGTRIDVYVPAEKKLI
jgi:signal transduction histidine kinase